MSISNKNKAMEFLAEARRKDFIPVFRHGKYEMCRCKTSNIFGFKKGDRLVAASNLRLTGESSSRLDPRIHVAQFEYIAVDFLHRRKGLAKKLIEQWMDAYLLDQHSLKISVASMPDGEPSFLRRILEKAGCKPTKGINTEGMPMLFYRHPQFIGDVSFTERDYRQPPKYPNQ